MINYKLIELLIIDVDGTMTDSSIYYDTNGNELKKFCTKDAAGFFAAQYVGIKIMVLTGRECYAVTKRMNDLKVEYVFQNIKDKFSFLLQFMHEHDLHKEDIAYIGDDLNDLSAMSLAAFIGCPSDACNEVKSLSEYISSYPGGHGAVRDIIMYLLTKRNQWNDAIHKIYTGNYENNIRNPLENQNE